MKVLILGSQNRFEKFMPKSAFAEKAEKIYLPKDTPEEEILAAAGDAEAIAVDAIGRVPGSLIRKMPTLKIIYSEGVAFNGIDCEAAKECGIYVCNNKGFNSTAVAEQVILLMLGLLRSVIPGHRAVLEGGQIEMKERLMFEGIQELGDLKVGLIGFGDVAKATARMLAPFGPEICYCDVFRAKEEVEKELNVTFVPQDELVRTCDIISIHVPVTEQTKGMVNEAFLSAMKPTAYLINTARGEMVDNEALCKALINGTIAGAGIDTIAPEPVTKDNPLVNLPEEAMKKVLYSPHLGGITTSTFRRGHVNIWKAFETVAEGGRPANIVNGL